MGLSDDRCDALTQKGSRCTRRPVFGLWDFTWCSQHIPQYYRDLWAEQDRVAEAAENREALDG